jgi:hypothetical protein
MRATMIGTGYILNGRPAPRPGDSADAHVMRENEVAEVLTAARDGSDCHFRKNSD